MSIAVWDPVSSKRGEFYGSKSGVKITAGAVYLLSEVDSKELHFPYVEVGTAAEFQLPALTSNIVGASQSGAFGEGACALFVEDEDGNLLFMHPNDSYTVNEFVQGTTNETDQTFDFTFSPSPLTRENASTFSPGQTGTLDAIQQLAKVVVRDFFFEGTSEILSFDGVASDNGAVISGQFGDALVSLGSTSPLAISW